MLCSVYLQECFALSSLHYIQPPTYPNTVPKETFESTLQLQADLYL